ncbi:hypothetical protein BDN67DRAFT_985105 [Paxillus ammoniavirescens]|nr:hypothetical protein BDN67DRAFT_985105 [Paxillus ammoniavirescens]
MIWWGHTERSLCDWSKNSTGTVFLSQSDLEKMEHDVEDLRNPPHASKQTARRKGKHVVGEVEDTYEEGMRILTSVLDGCNDSFLVADEKHLKASTRFFVDTGIMALLCHHDCVIHLANMTSAGEKQHCALVLLKALFDQLPNNFCVIVSWNAVVTSGDSWRISFLKYLSPSQCSMYSVTNGPASLSIIHANRQALDFQMRAVSNFGVESGHSYLPFVSQGVAQFHQRLFVIDFQVSHLDRKSLVNLGGWLRHQWDHVQEKKAIALDGFNKSSIDRVPRRSKNKGEEAVMQTISIQRSLESQEATLHELKSSQLLDMQLAACRSKISQFNLFKLDVDDDIWQDLGLDDDESSAVLPGWLADEKVEQCEEEKSRIVMEQKVMQEWFMEEWSRIQTVKEGADDNLAYEFGYYGEGVLSEDEDREDSEDSGSDLGGDDELLNAVEEFALVDEPPKEHKRDVPSPL